MASPQNALSKAQAALANVGNPANPPWTTDQAPSSVKVNHDVMVTNLGAAIAELAQWAQEAVAHHDAQSAQVNEHTLKIAQLEERVAALESPLGD